MNEIKLSKDFLVTVHNDLVQARFTDSLTINEQKILFAVLSNIEPPEFDIDKDGKRVIKEPVKEIEPFRVPIKDFTEWLGFKDPNYAAFKSTVKKLMKKLIEIQQPDGSWEVFQWVTKSSYIAKEGIAEIKLSPELYPYLLNLEKNFTTTKLNVLLSFKSIYSSRLYQLVKKWEKIGSWKVEVEELKKLLGVPIAKEVNGKKIYRLAQYGHFKQRALDVAIKEINIHSEFDITMVEHKTVRKITALTFNIKKSKKKKLEDQKTPESTQNGTEGNAGEDTKKTIESSGIYAESFKLAYEQKSRKYYDKVTGEFVLFDDEERVKAIILNNKFKGIGNDACYTIEKLLMKIINIPSFKISQEVHFLFMYTNGSPTIKQPEAFIISKLNQLVENVLKGNTDIQVKDLINIKGDNKVEVLPDWWFEGEASKRVSERKKQIAFELERLGDSRLTLRNARYIQLMISVKKLSDADDQIVLESIGQDFKGAYEDYKKLNDIGILEKMMDSKKEELNSLGYLDPDGKISDEALTKIYQNELKSSA